MKPGRAGETTVKPAAAVAIPGVPGGTVHVVWWSLADEYSFSVPGMSVIAFQRQPAGPRNSVEVKLATSNSQFVIGSEGAGPFTIWYEYRNRPSGSGSLVIST